MALPSLALGLGLQGEYDYKHQANLELARERGRAKAEQDAKEAAAKKRAPYERALLNLKGEGLLPVHQKVLREKVATAINHLADNPDDLQSISQMTYDIESSTAAWKNQAEQFQKLQSNKGLYQNSKALNVLSYSSDPDEIEAQLRLLPGSTIQFDKGSLNLNMEVPDSKPLNVRFDEMLAKGGDKYYEIPSGTSAEVITVNGKNFVNAPMKPEASDLIVADIKSDRGSYISAQNAYAQELDSSGKGLPDLRTEEGLAEYYKGLDSFIKQKADNEVALRSKQVNVTPSKASVNNFYIGPEAAKENVEMGGGRLRLDYTSYGANSEWELEAQSLSDVALGNFSTQLNKSSRVFDISTGEPITGVGVANVKMNNSGLYYVVKKDIKLGDTKFRKGMIIPTVINGEDNYTYLEAAKKLGVADVEIMRTGTTTSGPKKSVYVPVDDTALTEYMESNPKDRPNVKKLQEQQRQKREELRKAFSSGSATPSSAPKAQSKEKKQDTPALAPSKDKKYNSTAEEKRKAVEGMVKIGKKDLNNK